MGITAADLIGAFPNPDDEDADDYVIGGNGVTTVANLILQGVGGSLTPNTPNGYIQRVVTISVTCTATGGVFTLKVTNGTTTYTVWEYYLGSDTSITLDGTQLKIVCPNGYHFQGGGSAGTFDVQLTVRLTFGGGAIV